MLDRFFNPQNDTPGIHPSCVVESSASISSSASIGANCYIGHGVTIGDRTLILPNAVIYDHTVIGQDCIIKSGAVIGQNGFGFEYDEQGRPVHFPHFGKVVIGNHVCIGANTAIDRGTLSDTVIADHVKMDNLVHIAHNDRIDENTFVIAGASLGGGVHVGRNCWIAPNACVRQQLRIGDRSLVGLGAVVIRDVDEDTTMACNPARS